MINTNELMLGNILIDRKGRYCVVEKICKELDDCGIYAHGTSTTSLPLEYVKVTPLILQDLNFELRKDGRWWFKSFWVSLDNGYVNVGTDWLECEDDSVLNYEECSFHLHTLQNVYSILNPKRVLNTINILQQNNNK